jgi:ABC-type multidrug transport system fused ATPase/permease subunit
MAGLLEIEGVHTAYDKADVLEGVSLKIEPGRITCGPVAELVGIEGGVVSGVINLESSGVEASDWRPRHDEQYYEA